MKNKIVSRVLFVIVILVLATPCPLGMYILDVNYKSGEPTGEKCLATRCNGVDIQGELLRGRFFDYCRLRPSPGNGCPEPTKERNGRCVCKDDNGIEMYWFF